MISFWRALPLFILCLLATASAHNINVQVWLPTAPLSERDSTAWESLKALAIQHQFTVDSSSSPLSLEMANLQNTQVILFLNRNGADLSTNQQADVTSFINAGGGFVGIHDGLIAEASWPMFDTLIGAQLGSLLPSQQMSLLNTDKIHPATHDLPFRQNWTSPWYDFQQGPRENAHILLSVRRLQGSSFRGEHPVSWARLQGRGRVFATTLGADKDAFESDYVKEHLLGAIEWAGAAMEGDVRVSDYRFIDQSILADNIEGCMAMDVAVDGRVFYAEKKGRLYQWSPQTQTSKLLLDWSNTGPDHRVYFPFENGLFGLALAPDFPNTPYIYVHYSFTGSNPWGPGTGQQRVSRLEVIGDSVDASSEEVLIEYDFDRDAQIHSAGCLAFDPAGNLLIAAGDNTSYGSGTSTNPYNPADPRAGNEISDAQRTSANTASLRGKILRISPSAMIGGGYTIPTGNLFPDTDSTAGEIYIMGVRNPFKICIDPQEGWLAWGDVGPDATTFDSLRGPIGRDEFNIAFQAGNFGWPYMLANNLPFREYDYDTEISGDWFDPNQLVNLSPNNTGKKTLPPAQPAAMWMDKTVFTPEWPELGNGNVTAMAGAFYRYDSTITDPNKFPAYYDGTLFLMDWTRNWIKAVKLDSTGQVVKVSPFMDSLKVEGPMDLKVGPDGALYLMEWRSDKWGGTTSRIVRLRYAPEGRSPVAVINADRNSGGTPLTVQFDGSDSFDPDNQALSYSWDFGDGSPLSNGVTTSHTFTQPGIYAVRLEVENTDLKTGLGEYTITAGNNRPEVTINYPFHGGVFGWGEQIDFSFDINDVEDGSTSAGDIDCADVIGQLLLGHDAHAHPSVAFTDCSGSFSTSPEGHVTYEDELYLLFEASYTDSAPAGSGSLTGSAIHLLHPKQKQAEHYSFADGVSRVPTKDTLSIEDLIFEKDSAWIAIEPLNLFQINSFRLRLAGSGGIIQLWKGGLDTLGQLVVSANLPSSSNDSSFITTPAIAFSDPGGTDVYYFRFIQIGTNSTARLNWIEFEGAGLSVANDPFTQKPTSRAAPIQWQLMPNPASKQVSLSVRGEAGDVQATLMNSQGKALRTQNGKLNNADAWKTTFSLHGFAPGLYLLRLQQDEYVAYSKLLVY